MTLNDYQIDAHKTADYDCCPPWLYPAMGLSEEAGEVAGKLAKAVRDSAGFVDLAQMKKELGDVLWMLSELSAVLGFTLEEIASSNLEKLADRKARNKIHGEGDDR